MKKSFILFFLLGVFSFPLRIAYANGLPACVQKQVDVYKQKSKSKNDVLASSDRYNGKTVYVIQPGCCDQYTVMMDENCSYICAPSGGMTGRGDGKCIDFHPKGSEK